MVLYRLYCCCCTSNLDAAKFIGITYQLLHIIGLIQVFILVNKLEGVLSDLTYGAIGILVTLVLVDLGLIHGIFNKNGCLLMTWSAVTAIFTVLQAIGTIWALSLSFDLALFLVGIAIILANIRAILTVSMAKKEIDQEKRNAVISIAGQEVASNTQIKCIA